MIETWMATEPKFKEAVDRGTLFSLGFFVIQIVMAINFPLETLFCGGCLENLPFRI